MLFVPNLFGIGIRYADCLWSVGAEEQFYLVWPWFVQKVKRERVPYFLVLIVVGFTFAPHIIDYLNSHFFKTTTSFISLVISFLRLDLQQWLPEL